MKKHIILINFVLIFIMFNANSQDYFTPVWSGNALTPTNFIIYDATINSIDLEVGDSIAVLDYINGDLSCVGAARVNTAPISSTNPLYIVASQDDGTGNGFTPFNEIIYLFWDNSESKIISLIEESLNHSNYEVEILTELNEVAENELILLESITWS